MGWDTPSYSTMFTNNDSILENLCYSRELCIFSNMKETLYSGDDYRRMLNNVLKIEKYGAKTKKSIFAKYIKN